MAYEDETIGGRWLLKHLSVAALQQLLAGIGDDLRMTPDRVGNLALLDPKTLEIVGYIDLGDEVVEDMLSDTDEGTDED